MGDMINASSPFTDGFFAGIDGESDAFLTKQSVQLLDTRGVGLIDEGMVDIANGGSSLDACETVDGEDLLESEGSE